MDISVYFREPRNYQVFQIDDKEVTIDEQKTYVQLIRNKLNTFKTHEEQIEYIKQHRKRSKRARLIEEQLWKIPSSDLKITSRAKGINRYYDRIEAEREILNKNQKRSLLDKTLRTKYDSEKTRMKDRGEQEFTDKAKLENMKRRAERIRISEGKSPFKKRETYVKRTSKGAIFKGGKVKTYGALGKAGINFYNNVITSKFGKTLGFIVTHAYQIGISIIALILLAIGINITAGVIGYTGMMGQSPFVLCSVGGSGDKEDSGEVSDVINIAPLDLSTVNLTNPKLEDVTKFAQAGVNDTFGVSDSKAEEVVLAANLPVFKKYNVDKSNISKVTKMVKENGVSPIFFYVYAMNEVSYDNQWGSGFINHYPSGARDAYLGLTIGQTLENDIKIDCKYIVEQSKKDGRPATGGGEPADMPTGPAQSVLDKCPRGSIGRIYIPATSAVTAEIADLSGQTGEWTGLYGRPISEVMKTIGHITGQGGGSSAPEDDITGNCNDVQDDNGGASTAGMNDALKTIAKDNKKKAYGSGQCYALTSKYVSLLTGGKLNLGANGAYGGVPTVVESIPGNMAPAIGDTGAASALWNAWNWNAISSSSKYKFTPKSKDSIKYKDLQVGDIVSYGNVYSPWGHTAVVASIDGNNKYSVYEQNYLNPDGSLSAGNGSPISGPNQRDFNGDGKEWITGIVQVRSKK